MPVAGGSKDAALATQLHALLDEYEDRTLALFAAIENGTAFEAAASNKQRPAVASSSSSSLSAHPEEQHALFNKDVLALISDLHTLDATLQHTLHALALPHTIQQHTISALVTVQRARDDARRAQIEKLSAMKAELDRLVKRGREERREAEKAEAEPLAYKHVLNYASYISRITSAPPGYRPPGVSAKDEKAEGSSAAAAAQEQQQLQQQQQQQQQQHIDWPFPSEAQMRRGALAAAAAARAAAGADDLGPGAATAAAAAAPRHGGTAAAEAAGLDVQQVPQNFPLPDQHHPPQHQGHYGHPDQQMDTEDAFDLDLN
ncbi:hypothetical protein OC834_005956 [Tilletia horrida]|nr:hypothetical protein OC834_005956 [Tilletia horrida]